MGGVSAPVRAEGVRGLRLPERAADLGRTRSPRTARQAHLAELTSGHPSYAHEGSYRADAVVGVERRYPFMDRRLAELCLSLPGDQKLRDGWTRSIMRRALTGVLPEVVLQRPGKADLSHTFVRGLLGSDRPRPRDAGRPTRPRRGMGRPGCADDVVATMPARAEASGLLRAVAGGGPVAVAGPPRLRIANRGSAGWGRVRRCGCRRSPAASARRRCRRRCASRWCHPDRSSRGSARSSARGWGGRGWGWAAPG